jgi:hypothetical protein
MMTSEATPVTGDGVPFENLSRKSWHRASWPTIEAAKAETWAAQQARGGRAPLHDTVILAALRIAGRDRAALLAEIERIESETFARTAQKDS